ncbi:MAG: NUDIX domain-containing protein [Myxococcota bacterium]
MMGAEDFPRPAVTVDLVIFTVQDADVKVLLIRRGTPPFEGQWALPGGFVRVDDSNTGGESVEDAAYRELLEETSLPRESVYLEQLYTFGRPDRDPRMRVISVAWCALVRPDLAPRAALHSDAALAQWWPLRDKPALAFDHDDMVRLALDRIRNKIDYTPLAFELVPPTFTVGELRTVYEAIHGEVYDRGNFRRRFNRLIEDGLISQVPGKRATSSKPARVYRFNRLR